MNTIEVNNLSKQYLLGGVRTDSIRDWAVHLMGRSRRVSKKDELWALRSVSFDVQKGETLGIIGNNGAGKSTLLKILSRITKPTIGTARIRGRVASLLEVGTGFHNELTGRENIYLNGAILGMRRAEIRDRFDEIVDFSEIERFLDTPLKHYSSGMYMRLAFSVAAHLEPEILIVDEVLAVGDFNFQRKCLNKMRDAGQSGRTIFFVSHDMQAITRLCSRVIWLKDGTIAGDGPATALVSEYLHEQSQTGPDKVWDDAAAAPGNEVARLRRVRVCDENGGTVSAVDIRKRVGVEISYEVCSAGRVIVPNLQLTNERGVCLFTSADWHSGWRDRKRDKGVYVSTVWIPGNFLAEGSVFVAVAMMAFKPLTEIFAVTDVVTFAVIDSLEGDSARGGFAGPIPGLVRPVLDWNTELK